LYWLIEADQLYGLPRRLDSQPLLILIGRPQAKLRDVAGFMENCCV